MMEKGYNDIRFDSNNRNLKIPRTENEVFKAIEKSKTSIVYLLEAEINFLEDPYSKWNPKISL